jgi:hypothetical protein
MKSFEQISQHSSYRALPMKVQTLLRASFENPAKPDLLAALHKLNPKSAQVSMDIQRDTLRTVLKSAPMLTLLAFAVFDIDLSALEDVPPLPGGGDLL